MLEAVYLLYAALCAVLFGILHRRSPREAVVKFVFAAAFPVLGLLFPLFWRKTSSFRSDRAEKLESYLRHDAQDDPYRVLRIRDTEKELNVVPLEEALLVGDLGTRRRTMIDLLNQDATDYLEVLRLAVANEDTETSHYAVSALVELKRKLNRSLQELSVRYETSRSDAEFLEGYSEVLRNYIRSGFLDAGTLQRLKYTLAEVLQSRIDADPVAFTVYEEKADIELELGNFAAAEHAALQYADRFPDREEPYLLLMNLYYTSRSPELFRNALLRLKQSGARLSSEGLKSVRFWSEGA
ncbi:hypothetical protein [Paenibacillus pinistramenti]|uniref:hypothetical protein n=1 Tax=Paenibacillus pinistramenti TaxID=1768003 RepID=UPI00110967F6|nr:hypothetical protein [Paenibacillus pinistramenti]